MAKKRRYPVTVKTNLDLKIYRYSPYLFKKVYNFKKNVKRVAAFVGVGVIVFYGSNLVIGKSNVNASEINNNASLISSVYNDIDNGIEPTEIPLETKSDVNTDFEAYNEFNNQNNVEIKSESESEKVINYNIFGVGSNDNKSYVEEFLQGEAGSYVYEYSEMYGVDPNIIAAMCMQESSLEHYDCIPEGSRYNGYGVGIMQLECPSGQEVTCYNYDTQEWETDYITMDRACNIETNIKLGCMVFQNSINSNNGNVLLAIQSHNYGQGMINCLLQDAYGDDYDTKKSDYSNVDWLEYVKKAHINPQAYVSNWEESSYGDCEYINHVLAYCPVNEVKYKYGSCEYTFDLTTLKVVEVLQQGKTI